MRASKLVLTYGPGSIMDLSGSESVMILSPDYWRSYQPVHERRLAQKLGVHHFGSPNEEWDSDNRLRVGISSREFPFNKLCPNCQRLIPLTKQRQGKCPDCGEKTIPPRLVAACKNGHIEDFPWQRWIGCTCSYNDAKLYVVGFGSATSDLTVICKTCNKERNLARALEELPKNCSGRRPWLGVGEDCDSRLKGLMRGASNVYFPIIESSLSIPPYSEYLHKLLRPHLPTIEPEWRKGTHRTVVESLAAFETIMKKESISVQDILTAIDELLGSLSDIHLKWDEWRSLVGDVKIRSPRDDFQKELVDIRGTQLENVFQSIWRVTRLREVVAITGFTRINPFNGDFDKVQKLRMTDIEWHSLLQENQRIHPNPDLEKDRDWLPGTEMYGEGIFFEFRKDVLTEWENRDEVRTRFVNIFSQPGRPFEREGVLQELPRTLLLHSFAHQIIRRISLACGYSMASLRERLYSELNDGIDMRGVLIYTASPDSEGTLGGLISQAYNSATLLSHIRGMIESVKICSQDPLCGAHDSTVTGMPWGASCHSCSQLPETSCEGMQNKLLDRYTLFSNGMNVGFFDEF